MAMEVMHQDATMVTEQDPVDAWIRLLVDYLQNPSTEAVIKIKQRALNYVLVRDVLYKKSTNGSIKL